MLFFDAGVARFIGQMISDQLFCDLDLLDVLLSIAGAGV